MLAIIAPMKTVRIKAFSPHILRLKPGATQLEVWATDDRFAVKGGAGLDGIAIGSDDAVYVNTYNGGGLYRVGTNDDGSAGVVTTMRTSRPIRLPDALRAIGPDTFLMIEGRARSTASRSAATRRRSMSCGTG